MSSPLFFPMVRWWEYDFRYRADLRILIFRGQEQIPARLTDLRRKAGCLICFENLGVGETLRIGSSAPALKDKFLEFKTVSVREPVKARGLYHGVYFVDKDSLSTRNHYLEFENYWQEKRRRSLRNKFRIERQSEISESHSYFKQ